VFNDTGAYSVHTFQAAYQLNDFSTDKNNTLNKIKAGIKDFFIARIKFI